MHGAGVYIVWEGRGLSLGQVFVCLECFKTIYFLTSGYMLFQCKLSLFYLEAVFGLSCLSVHPNFLKIRSLVFSDIVHDDS